MSICRKTNSAVNTPMEPPREFCAGIRLDPCSASRFLAWRAGSATSTGTTPGISRRPTTPSLQRGSFRSHPKYPATSPPSRSRTTSMSPPGSVIAQIDDRDYRIALAQAEAQVAGAQAAIKNVDAQIDVQQAQIRRQRGASRAGAGRAGVRAAAGGPLSGPGATGSGTIQNEQQFDSQLRQQQAALSSAQAASK